MVYYQSQADFENLNLKMVIIVIIFAVSIYDDWITLILKLYEIFLQKQKGKGRISD